MIDLEVLCNSLEKISKDLQHTIDSVRAGLMPVCVCCNVLRVTSPGAMLCAECLVDDLDVFEANPSTPVSLGPQGPRSNRADLLNPDD